MLMEDTLVNIKVRGTVGVWYKLIEASKTSNGIQPHTSLVALLNQVIFHNIPNIQVHSAWVCFQSVHFFKGTKPFEKCVTLLTCGGEGKQWTRNPSISCTYCSTQSFVGYISVHSKPATPALQDYSLDKSLVYRSGTWKYQQTLKLMLSHTEIKVPNSTINARVIGLE